MKKQKKQFLLLCLVVVIFGGIFLGLQLYNKNQEEKQAAEEAAEQITVLSLDAQEITAFSYLYEGETLAFEKEEDVWYVTGDHSISLDQDLVANMLAYVAQLTAQQQITAPEDLEQYGLLEPENIITFEMGDETVTVSIGALNSFTYQYYMMVSQDDNVYLVESPLVTGFQKSVVDLTLVEETDTDTTEDTVE